MNVIEDTSVGLVKAASRYSFYLKLVHNYIKLTARSELITQEHLTLESVIIYPMHKTCRKIDVFAHFSRITTGVCGLYFH